MRVLLVTAGYLPDSVGGVELHVHALARELARRGHRVSVFSRSDDPAAPALSLSRDRFDGVEVLRLCNRFETATDLTSMYDDDAIRGRFLDAAVPFRPDVVHVHHLTCLSTGILEAARTIAPRVVMTLHDYWMGCPRGQRITPELERCETLEPARCATCVARMWPSFFGRPDDAERMAGYQRTILERLALADVLVTPSEAARRVFVAQGVHPGKIRAVENGLDTERLSAVRHRPSDRFRVGYLGTVIPSKGVHVALEAAVRLARPDVEFHVYGAAPPWHEVTGYAERLQVLGAPLGDRFGLHGRYEAERLPEILSGLDALVVPSLWPETFCLTLREGWLAGIPVAASAIGAMADAIDDGETGLLLPPGDVEAWAEALARLADDVPLRERLARSPKRVRDVGEMTDELLALYQGREAA